MKAGLMEKVDMDNLGFGQDLDWNNEEEERKKTFTKIEEIKRLKMSENQSSEIDLNMLKNFYKKLYDT